MAPPTQILKVYQVYRLVSTQPQPETLGYEKNQLIPNYFSPSSLTNLQLAEGEGFEAVSSLDNELFIGTNHGWLLHLSATSEGDPKCLPTLRLVNRVQVSAGKLVSEICVYPAQRILLVLADSVLRFFNFGLEPVEGLPVIKGVRAFSLGMRQQELGLLMVARRRSVLCFQLGKQLLMKKEINWQESIVNICTNATTLCIADASAYSLVDIRTGRATRLFCPPFPRRRGISSGVMPSLVSIDEDEFLVTSPAGEDGAMGMFVSSMGDAVRGTITWDFYPRKVVLEFPFVLALTKRSVEVHNIMTQASVQVVELGDAVHSLVDHAGLWRVDAQLDAQLNAGLPSDAALSKIPASILLCGPSWVGCLCLESALVQINHLLETNQAEAAVSGAEEVSSMLSEQSLHYARMSRELRHAYQKCGFFYLGLALLDDAILLLQRGRVDPRVLIALFPELRVPPSSCEEYLQAQRVVLDPGLLKLVVEMDSVHHIVQKSIYQSQSASPALEPAAATMASNLTEMLRNYLVEHRSRAYGRGVLSASDREQMVATDTALLKLLSHDSSSLEAFLASENLCDLDACLAFFQDQKNPYAESLIYQARGDVCKSLELWMALYEAGNPAVTLRAIAECLARQDDPALIVRVAEWVAAKDPEIAAEAISQLPNHVFDELGHNELVRMLRTQGHSSPTPGLILFLEKLVFERESQDSEIHLQLAGAYLASLTHSPCLTSHQTQLEQMDHSFQVARTIRPQWTYLDFLASRKDMVAMWRKQLARLLLQSSCYPLDEMLALLEAGPVLLERAIVFGKLGQHRRALELLVQLKDFYGAEMYCVRGGSFKQTLPEDSAHFRALLDVYLAGDDEQAMMEQAESLLKNHYRHFQALQVLELLPTHWPVELFTTFFAAHLKAQTCRKLDHQILKAILISDNIQVNAHLASARLRASPLLIQPTTLCDKCNATIGIAKFVGTLTKHQRKFHIDCWSH